MTDKDFEARVERIFIAMLQSTENTPLAPEDRVPFAYHLTVHAIEYARGFDVAMQKFYAGEIEA